MKMEEKVTINLNAKNGVNPPVKFCKVRNGRPNSTKFKFVPKNFAHLSEFVECINWNSSQKKLYLSTSETSKFEVMKWLEFVENQYNEIQKSPFVDLDTNAAVLTFFDSCDIEVATVRFKNIKLEDHNCTVSKEGANLTYNYLRHSISLSYQYATVSVNLSRTDEKEDKETNSSEDYEWQTIETP